tara:strand:+ start:4419 stop:6965 length:2547 start_codon:yes stop_codon:yes gene_type:complete
MFTNAGMVQFKNAFTGLEELPFRSATTSQKCVRAGGKHNDLDNVGYTSRHHTFFEMLGNFSFGDYFKDRAIELAWELVTKEFGLSPDRLLVTVYSEDTDAELLWKKIAGLNSSQILKISTSDNFWAMGDTGPCGPCSEIFFDHGDKIEGGPPGSDNEDGDRFVEIWNLVFMQFEQCDKNTRIDLPRPAIDTGMGLERIAAILQGKHDNYEIDLFQKLIDTSINISGAPKDTQHTPSHRVVADHLRASAFLLADNVTPSNEGRGYVLRRIMRRAMRHAHLMGCTEPLMYRLVNTLVQEMGKAFPELIRAESLITETLRLEEERFKSTLSRGLKLLKEATDKLPVNSDLPGKVAFQLYDTYGFPLDLTEDALRAIGKKVDTKEFHNAMDRQRQEARRNWTGSGGETTDQIWFSLREEHGPTEFLGYESETIEAQITAIIKDNLTSNSLSKGEEGAVIVNQSTFYGESGGQIGDTGTIVSKNTGGYADVTDTLKKADDLLVHIITVTSGEINVGDAITLTVDSKRRQSLRCNHSATHLLHAALRNNLGDHVAQKGSLVAEDRLRFDISHPNLISDEQIHNIEYEVNNRIRENLFVNTQVMNQEQARDLGALALFGEKYGEEVRVVSIEGSDSKNPYSRELCGGTHVTQTGNIGLFKIISESATAAGVRRIEALTGSHALAYSVDQESLLKVTAEAIKVATDELPDRVVNLLEERKRLEREVKLLQKKLATGSGDVSNVTVKKISGVNFLGKQISGLASRDLRSLVDDLLKETGSGIVAVVSIFEKKASLTIGVSEDLQGKFSAVDLVRFGVEKLGGKGGGGRSDMAQGGGPNTENAEQALMAIQKKIKDAP